MPGSSPPVDALEPEGWSHDGSGEIAEGKPQSKGGWAHFKHSRALQAQDVLRMQVVQGRNAFVGFAAESYNVEWHSFTINGIAVVQLSNGTTCIFHDISQDEEKHNHSGHLKDHIPETLPYNLALRITKDGNLPQIQFNDDGVWHDFAPDRAALKAGPWFPHLWLDEGDRLSDHCVHHPKPTKSAGKTSEALAASSAASAAGGAGAAVGLGDANSCVPIPQEK